MSGIELLFGKGLSLPRNDAVITVPVMFSCGTFQATKPFSHRGRAVTRKEWDVVREKRKATRKRDRSC